MGEDAIVGKKQILKHLLSVYVVTYMSAFVVVGVFWDANGANLLARSFADQLWIFINGLLWVIPMSLGSFMSTHPVPIVLGVGYFACFIVAMKGLHEATGRRLLYVLLSLFTILGTFNFFLMA